VAVRVRPPRADQAVCVSAGETSGTVITTDNSAERNGKQLSFSYARAFFYDAPDPSTRAVYDAVGRALVEQAMKGYNVSMLAYGQTGACSVRLPGLPAGGPLKRACHRRAGSGKTHTCFGTPGDPGLVQMFAQELFTRLEALAAGVTATVTVAIIEIYNERRASGPLATTAWRAPPGQGAARRPPARRRAGCGTCWRPGGGRQRDCAYGSRRSGGRTWRAWLCDRSQASTPDAATAPSAPPSGGLTRPPRGRGGRTVSGCSAGM